MKKLCEFCKKPIGIIMRMLNSMRGDPNTFCRDSHAIFYQQKLRSEKIIKEIKQLLENKQSTSDISAKSLPVKPSPIRKCPQCFKFFETSRPIQNCCSRSCARIYFYATHQVKYNVIKKPKENKIAAQIELFMKSDPKNINANSSIVKKAK
jgi:hypothetical protein